MYQLIKLIKNLENELQELVGPESISLRISNNPNFDFQINNLVKFQNHKKIKNIQNSFYKIIDKESSIFERFEFTGPQIIELFFESSDSSLNFNSDIN